MAGSALAGRRLRALAARQARSATANPYSIHKYYTGALEVVPDPVEFVVSPEFLNRPNVYPRQITLTKVVFLRDDLFTSYDWDVLEDWETTFRSTGYEGISPGIEQRIIINSTCSCGHRSHAHRKKEQSDFDPTKDRDGDRLGRCNAGGCECLAYDGRPWFRETEGVIGRRGSKGYLGGLWGSYVLWNYMHRPGGPQAYYGIDRDKRLTGIVFAGKKEQAQANLWKDLNNVITGAPCFAPYISRPQTERLTIFAPNDVLRQKRQEALGIFSEADLASFEIVPAPSTTMAARGPTSFCLDPSTPVLTADLRWIPIGEVKPGDHLVGMDEFPERKGAQRKMRDAEVLHVWRTRSAPLRLTFEDGSSVVCSANHRWLVREMGRGGTARWREAQNLGVGSRIKWVADPWGEDDTRDGGYLAGFFDGEGCVSGWAKRVGKSVLFSQNEGPVLSKVMRLLDERGYDLLRYSGGGSRCQQWGLVGSAQAMRFLGSIRPTRLLEKSASVWEGVAPRGGTTWTGRARPDGHKTVVSIERLPEQDLVDIETTTKTFLANGLVSHNCQMYDEQAHVLNSTANADAEQVYQCLDPSTRVLTADLEWKPISEVEVGDRLVSMDEFSDGRNGSPRKMREAEVLGKGESVQESYRITFEDGAQVVCSGLHRWLRATPGDKNFKWATIDRPTPGPNMWPPLRVGDRIRHLVDPWVEDGSRDGGYLAGVFDGEGHVRFSERGSMRVTFTQKPGSVLSKTLRLLHERGYEPRVREDTPSGCTELLIEGLAECWRLLGEVNPLRLRENARFLWQGRAVRRSEAKVIVSIEPVGARDLIDIETSTKTFIAEGLVSHNSATPALDQFGNDGFIYAPSSPWAKTGQFFQNWELAIEMEPDGTPSFPERMMVQLPSWGPYEDWEDAIRIPLRPMVPRKVEEVVEVKRRKKVNGKTKTIVVQEVREIEKPGYDSLGTFAPLKKAIQAYDDNMRQLQRANPDTFKVERLSRWAESLDAYLNPDKVAEIFKPWRGRRLFVQEKGVLRETYSAHGDPATSNKRFGWSMGHRVWVPKLDEDGKDTGDGMYHVVFDTIRCWEPADFPEHILDYEDGVMPDIWEDVKNFVPEDVSFDQFNVPATIGWLRKKLAREQLPKAVRVHEVVRTRQVNWRHYELFKSAINMGLVHAPMYLRQEDEEGHWKVNYASSEVENELKFLEEKNGVVNHPSTGPVQTKDIADCLCEVVVQLIGKQMATLLGQEFDMVGLSGAAPQGTDPGRHTRTNDAADRLANLTGGMGRGMGQNAARGGRGMRRR